MEESLESRVTRLELNVEMYLKEATEMNRNFISALEKDRIESRKDRQMDRQRIAALEKDRIESRKDRQIDRQRIAALEKDRIEDKQILKNIIKEIKEVKAIALQNSKDIQQNSKAIQQNSKAILQNSTSIDTLSNKLDSFAEQMFKRIGDLDHSIGSFVENMAAPNIPVIAQKRFNCQGEPIDLMVRRKIYHPKDASIRKEFDVIAVYPDVIIYNETRASPRDNDLNHFAKSIKTFFDFFPEHREKKLIPIFSSLYIDPHLVARASRLGIYVLVSKGDTMDIVNPSLNL